jgi:penicillin-binding protein 1B
LKSALVKSSNVIAVKTAMDVGLGTVAKTAREFGFENIQTYPSMALGTMETTPLQLAAAYAVFANGGTSVEPTFIDKVVSGSDEMLHLSTPKGKQVIREQTAYMVTDALMDVVRRGTAAKAAGALGKNVVFAGKTGTSKDGWFVGYTPNLVTVAWVGLDDNQDIHATGGDIAVPLWVDFMREVVRLRPEFGGASFAMPKGLTEVVVDPETGMAAGPYCPQRETAVVPTSAATSVTCFKHEPLNMMYAMADVHDTDPTVTTIEASEVTPSAPNTRHIVEYEDYNGDRPDVRRSSGSETALPSSRTEESYLEQYERSQAKTKKP